MRSQRLCSPRPSARRSASLGRIRRRADEREGVVLVWFAILVFALLPVMALVIDFGMVMLTRRIMQTAVQSAALEGLRLRDDPSIPPGEREERRREAAGQIVEALFDDDLSVTLDNSWQFGAGPEIELIDGIPLAGTDFHASRRIGLVGVYQPRLQWNLANEPHGDMVAGSYSVQDSMHAEETDYLRSDFVPDQGEPHDAFLVRMRRTADVDGHDDLPGTSSRGTPVPALYGRGPYGGPEFLDQQERGVIVRATAIAQAVPAMTGSWWDSGSNPDGVLPIWVDVSEWNAGGVDIFITPDSFAEFFVDLQGEVLTTVGATFSPGDAISLENTSQKVMLSAVINGERRVIGFGLADVELDAASGGRLTPVPESRIAVSQVSAALVRPSASVRALSAADWNDLFEQQTEVSNLLLAPALRRTIR